MLFRTLERKQYKDDIYRPHDTSIVLSTLHFLTRKAHSSWVCYVSAQSTSNHQALARCKPGRSKHMHRIRNFSRRAQSPQRNGVRQPRHRRLIRYHSRGAHHGRGYIVDRDIVRRKTGGEVLHHPNQSAFGCSVI